MKILLKQNILKISDFKIELLPSLISLIGIITLISLGIWQLYRLKEKNLFIASVANTLSNPPANLNSEPSIYSKIKIKGHFSNHKDIYLYGRRSMAVEKDGYYLISPFQTEEGKTIMIARGWFAAKDKSKIISIDNNDKEIIGVVLPQEKKKLFIPDNDLKNNVWFTLDLNEMSQYLGVKLENFYLLQIEPKDLSSLVKPLDANSLIKIKNDHLEYALTWFSLAIFLAVIFIVYHKQKFSVKP